MGQNVNWSAISGWASLAGLPSSVATFVATAPPVLSFLVYGTTTVAFTHWIFNKIKRRKFDSEILSRTTQAGDFLRKDFELLENETTLDILDATGANVNVDIIQKIKCKVNVAQSYYFRFSPDNCYSNWKIIKPFGSTFNATPAHNGIDIDVKLNRPYKKNEILTIHFNYKISNLFVDNENYWIHRRYFMGTNEVTLIIKFPQDRIPKNHSAMYFFNNDIKNGQLITKGLSDGFSDGKPVIKLQTDEVSVDFNIKLDWSW